MPARLTILWTMDNIKMATGNSQLTFPHALRDLEGIDWSKVNVFHMDEYLGR